MHVIPFNRIQPLAPSLRSGKKWLIINLKLISIFDMTMYMKKTHKTVNTKVHSPSNGKILPLEQYEETRRNRAHSENRICMGGMTCFNIQNLLIKVLR